MSLRDMASSSACAPSGAGASSSTNPLTAAADALLPQSSRTLARLAAQTPAQEARNGTAESRQAALDHLLQHRELPKDAFPQAFEPAQRHPHPLLRQLYPNLRPPPPLSAPSPAGPSALFEAAFADTAFRTQPQMHTDQLAAAFSAASIADHAHKGYPSAAHMPPALYPARTQPPSMARLVALTAPPIQQFERHAVVTGQTAQSAAQPQTASQSEGLKRSSSWGEEFTSLEGEQGLNGPKAALQSEPYQAVEDSVADQLFASGDLDAFRYCESFDHAYEQAFRDFLAPPESTAYRFSDNKEQQHSRSAQEALEEAERLREAGRLTAAVRTFEEALDRRSDDPHPALNSAQQARAWFLLGLSLAETDDDTSAIQALRQGLEVYSGVMVGERREEHPYLRESLVALSVSYTNELEQPLAYSHLREWFELWCAKTGVPRSSQRQNGLEGAFMDAGVQGVQGLLGEMHEAAQSRPEDVGIFIVMGVLHNLSREYSKAADALRYAVMLHPEDPSLWNKLGATLANGGEGDDALRAYRRAVDINPALIRAWVNVGTAYANRGEFDKAARYYLKSVSMAEEREVSGERGVLKDNRMPHVWGYLRTTLISMNRPDLLDLVDKRDVSRLRENFPF